MYSTYAFAGALQDALVKHATSLSDHYGNYDAHEEKLAVSAGKNYSYSGSIGLLENTGNPVDDWKYAPFFKVLQKQDAMQLVAIYVLLSVYVAILSLTACSVMSYVRSVTIAIDNKNMFGDLQKLGAGKNYVKRVLRAQLKRLYFFPAAAGCSIGLLFSLLLTYFNDMRLDVFEIRMLFVLLLLMVFIATIMYIMYRISLKKGEIIAEI